MNFLRIVPPATQANMATLAQGTRVLDENGKEIDGITRIELTAEIDNLWRARIECSVVVEDEIAAEAEVLTPAQRVAVDLNRRRVEAFRKSEEAQLNVSVAAITGTWRPTPWWRRIFKRRTQ